LAYRFVHAADIHLDSPLRSLALRDPALAELIGNATRRAFVAIVDLCLEQQVDALLLAGDLHDGDQTSMKTARFLAEQMRRLDEAGIQVFVIRGNHDALSKITKELTFPDSVKLFGPRAEAVVPERRNGNAPIAIHGLSFAKPQAPDSLLPQYASPTEGAVNIGLMHTSLDGAAGHDPYAPCNVADLKTAGFRYWALGHVHKRTVVEGGCTIVMPGMPQGRDINEAGPKSVTLVTVMDDGAIRIEEHVTSLAQFERVEADIAGIEDWRDMLDMAEKAISAARDRTLSKYLVARLHLTGATPLAWRMRRDADLLTEELKERAALAGDCWIERVEIDCTAPDAADGAADNPVLELRRLIAEEVVGSDAYQTEVMRIAEELRGQLPAECRTLLGADEEAFKAAVAGLVREGSDDVLARLHGKTGTAD
jgi:DNA repair protein SbcD/Mre11